MDASCDYSLRNVDEFDAISIEVTVYKQKYPSLQSKSRKFPAKTHALKVKQELGTEDGLIYLKGQASKSWEDTDAEAPFRQSRYAYYLSGADFPGTAVTYDISRDNLILWIPIRQPQEEVWLGALPGVEECFAKSHVDFVKDIKELQAYLEDVLDASKRLPAVYITHASQRPPQLSWERPAEGITLRTDTTHLLSAMDSARAIKTPYEISRIRKAVDISSAAHRLVQKHIKSLVNEAQVENLFRFKCSELGAKNQAYNVIAGAGPNAATLHYDANSDAFGDHQLMVLDAGCEFECYASDVTRTIPLNGHFSNEAKKVYTLVAQMQDECIDMIKPEASWAQISAKAVQIAWQGLWNMGILQRGGAGDAPDPLVVRAFFMHGLGHLVGLDVHDVIYRVGIRHQSSMASSPLRKFFGGKGLPWDAFEAAVQMASVTPLKSGMVITCEPGIYFNRAYIEDFLKNRPNLAQYVNKAMLEKYYPVHGCRIEDCILVTDGGHENFTTAPKGEEMIRIINGEA